MDGTLAVKDTPDPLDSAQLRAAFAGGITTASAEALLRARDTGLDWETATRAVADGLAEHYGSCSNSPPIRQSRPPAMAIGARDYRCVCAAAAAARSRT